MKPTTVRTPFYTLLFLLLISNPANADIGLPMLFVTLPAMLIALVPVVLVEAFVLSRRLNFTFADVLKPVAYANTFSTLIGVPLTWVALAALELGTGGSSFDGFETTRQKLLAVTWQAPWLMPHGAHDYELRWMMPTAMLVLLVPFFFASWLSEYLVMLLFVKTISRSQLSRGMLAANLASYVLLLLCVAFLFLWSAQH